MPQLVDRSAYTVTYITSRTSLTPLLLPENAPATFACHSRHRAERVMGTPPGQAETARFGLPQQLLDWLRLEAMVF